jgi:hypothetical protein
MILKAVAALTAITGNGPERFRTGLEGSPEAGPAHSRRRDAHKE